MRRISLALLLGFATLAACSNDPEAFEVVATFDDASPGDIISLRADGDSVEYINRRAGEIRAVSIPTARAIPDETIQLRVAKVDVSTDGEQRGLLGHTMIDGRRFAAWTEPGTNDLVVGDVTSGSVDRIVWAGTGTQSKAIGGHLDTRDGLLILGLGSLTDWAEANGSGAIVTLDPDGVPEQQPVVLSSGWNNPFAFAIVGDAIWVADNAPDGSDLPVAEREGERIATVDATGPSIIEAPPQRAPSAIVQLPDGRFGVCGYLDNEMRAYEVDNDGMLVRAGTIGACLTAAAVLDDGSIATTSTDNNGTPTLLIRPAN